ncbi:DUF2884 family protein [Rhodanobacter aciditrophus]|uniref:DUF2884 family protein n=1 Tax=Rhodanobacter aciditrophus TaxID=1623218 RepID=UPI003CEDA6E1
MSRHATVATLVFALGLALGLPAPAAEVHVRGDQCGYASNYDVRATPAGIDFRRTGGQPDEVFMHDGALSVDGRPVAVSADDAARLRRYEAEMRGLLPEMAGVAHEAVGIAYDALATVAATLGGSQHHRDQLVRQLNQSRVEALRGMEASISADHWSQRDFADAIAQPVTAASNQLASTLERSVMWSLFTGRASELEARADTVDQSVEKAMKARSGRLEARARAICPRLAELDGLQQQFRFRLADGQPLQLLTNNRDRKGKDSQHGAGGDEVARR